MYPNRVMGNPMDGPYNTMVRTGTKCHLSEVTGLDSFVGPLSVFYVAHNDYKTG